MEHILNIETKRCRIRQFKQSDVDDLYLILSNPKVMEYIETPFTLEDTKDFLNKNALSYPPRVFALEYKENKKLTSRHTKIFETFERFRCKNKQKRYSKNGKYGKNAVKSCKFVDKKRFQ